MENTLVIDDVPIKTSIHRGFPVAIFDYQRVCPIYKHTYILLRVYWYVNLPEGTITYHMIIHDYTHV